MIVKCPRCEHEFDLELETCVVEMLFECPDCTNKFMVGNTDNYPTKKAVETKYEPVQQVADAVQPQEEEKKESNNWVVNLLRLLVVLMLIFTICNICGWRLQEFIVLIIIGILGYTSILYESRQKIVDSKPQKDKKEDRETVILLKFIIVMPFVVFMVLLSFVMIFGPKFANWQSSVVIGLITILIIHIFCKTTKKLWAFVLCVIFAFTIACIYDYYENKKAMKDVSRYLENYNKSRVPASETETTQETAPEVPKEDIYTRVYKDGYKIGYTIDDKTYNLWGGEEYCRSLWGLAATYEMLHNEDLYKEFRRGLHDGMAKRKSDTGAEKTYY